MKLLIRHMLSLRAQRSNLAATVRTPVEIASSPPAPRNDTLCVSYFLVSDGLLRPMSDFNVYGRFRCRFAADAASGNNRFN
jgi:hypothetical protein